MLAYFLQVAVQHIEYIHGVFVVLLVHVVLVVLDVGLDVLDQSLREFREVVDVVQGVQYAVDESLGQFTHRGHLFLAYQFVLGLTQFVECSL